MKKKKSLREKGNAYQRWIRDWLWERGWTVRNFPMTSKPLLLPDKKNPAVKKLVWLPQNNDVFGCDLIARKGFIVLWIQSSLDEHISRRLEEFSKYFEEVGANESLMIWIKREKWHSIKDVRLDSKGTMIVSDLGKIQVGKLYLAQGWNLDIFGEKIRDKKDAKIKASKKA